MSTHNLKIIDKKNFKHFRELSRLKAKVCKNSVKRLKSNY